MEPHLSNPNARLRGHLDLVCAPDSNQRSYIQSQSFSAPFHISKPYWDGSVLVLQIINPTAGLFDGDTLESRITVEPHARFLITTPSASRVHTSRGEWATVEQQFSVKSKGWLDYAPAMLIPQAGGKYRQRTSVHLEPGAELLFFETLAPGRVARGETFEYEEIDWEANLYLDNALLTRERFFLRPHDGSITSLQNPFPTAYYASGYLITNRISIDSPIWEEVKDLNSDAVLFGVTRLMAGGWSLKLLARDSVSLKKTITQLRRILSTQLPELKTIPRML